MAKQSSGRKRAPGSLDCFASLVAVVTDQVRDGRTVIGYSFNSNGRYGQGGLIRERFAPRLRGADPASLLDDQGLLDPHRATGVPQRASDAATNSAFAAARSSRHSGRVK